MTRRRLLRGLLLLLLSLPATAAATATPTAAEVTAALDSLDLASGARRNAMFLGSIDGLQAAARTRHQAMAVLDEAALYPDVVLALDWPTRARWLERALGERHAEWSAALLETLGDRAPEPGSPSRGEVCLLLGLSRLRLLPDDPAARRAVRDRSDLDFRLAAGETFLLRDEALYRLWENALAREDTLDAEVWADSLATALPRSLRTPGTRITRVRRFLEEGLPDRALAEARLASPEGETAELLWWMAEAQRALGFPRQADTTLRRLIGDYGFTERAREAYTLLLAVPDTDPERGLTWEERIQLAVPLLAGPDAPALTDSLETWAVTAPTPRDRDLATLVLARRAYILRDYPAVTALSDSLADAEDEETAEEAAHLRARAFRNSNHPDMAAAYRELLTRRGSRASDAAWELPREFESLGRWAAAESAWTSLLADFPNHGKRRDARLRRGFVRTRTGDLEGALDDFTAVFREASGSDEEHAAYWRAWTLRELGREEEALAAARAATATTIPAGYYGVLLRELISRDTGEPDAAVPPPVQAEEPVETLVFESNWPSLVEWHFRRGLALARLGDLIQARAEWRRAAAVGRSVPRVRRALALAAATYNAYPEGITWAGQVAASLAPGDPRRPGYERLTYPTAYYGDVLAGAEDTGLDPVTVWSIMRQESLYDPLAVSRADARGLLQLLPATLRRMVREGSYPDAPVDVLFRPDVNILLGTRFFSERLREFGGALAPALASYNAGESKAEEWIELADGDTGAAFLECIGYPETYGYIRRIGWIDWLYRYYYGSSPSGAAPESR